MMNAHPRTVANRSSFRMLSKSMARPVARRNGPVGRLVGLVVMLGVGIGCPGQGGDGEAGDQARKRNMTITSRDEVLTVTLPADLHVHRHSNAVQGVSADGRFRVHIEHSPEEMLMKMVGRTKEVLRKRDWDITREKHYQHAIELRLKRGGVSGEIPEVRTLWWVTAKGRVLSCDGIAHAEVQHRVESAFKALCQGVKVDPPPPPPAPDADVGADAGADAGDGATSGPLPPPRPRTPQ